MARLCMGCMAALPEGETVCKNCGFIEGTGPKEGYHLAPETILANRYVIGKVIGYGGFGVTYVAWDAVLEKKVAVKEYLPGDFATRRPGDTVVSIYEGEREEQYLSGLKKFIEEAQRLAKLTEIDGVVRVFDAFLFNNTAYIIMEFLDGETLKDKLKRQNKLSYDETKSIVLPVLRTLDEVHKTGMIHRDIAPDNIFLLKDGRVKVLDFGAARFATTTHSKSLSVILKPGYAPEEQYRSRGEQGPWTDVYACSAMIYRMLSGIIPEDALERNAHDTLKDITELARLPQNAANAIMNGLNIKAEDRIQTAGELADAIEDKTVVERNIIKQKKENTGKIPLWVKIAAPIAACIIALCGVLYATGIFNRIVTINYIMNDRIPNVIGKLVSTVNKDLEIGGAAYRIVANGGDYDNNYEENIIMSQEIEAGRGIPDDFNELYVKVSKGTRLSYIPKIDGLSKENAAEQLKANGLEAVFVEVEAEGLADGTVIGADIDTSQPVEYGSKVEIKIAKNTTVADSNKKVTVPNVRELSFDSAKELAIESNLVIQIKSYEFSNYVKSGCIIDQTPVGGQTAAEGTVIKVTVSKGAENDSLIQIPDVRFMSEPDAIFELESCGFKVKTTEEYNDEFDKGIVFSQDTINERVKAGTVVNLTVSKGPSAIAVPDVVGLSEKNAKTKLTKKNFSYITVTEAYSDSVSEGDVISQVPAADTKLYPTDKITLTVSIGPKPPEIISVKGISLSASEKSVKKGDTFTLKATVSPADASNKEVVWVSSDSDIAEVSSAGVVDFIGAGNVEILAYTVDGEYSAGCNFTVTAAVPDISNKTADSAAAAVEQEGFKSSVQYAYSDTVPQGYVISYSPKGYNSLGTVINITGSKGVKPIPVTGITTASALTIKQGATQKLAYTINPSDATNQNCRWSSSNPSVASVSSAGEITAVKGGKATITVTTDDGGYSASCAVTVTVNVPDVTGLSESEARQKLTQAGFGSVTSTSEYHNTVKSGNIISYTPTGYNTVTTQVKLVVSKGIKPVPITGISLPSSLTVRKGSTSNLTLTISPSNATNKKCTWKSSNTSVATVSSSGAVTGVAGGKATITVTTDDGGYTASCTVTVTVNVPDVTGLSESEARQKLTQAGFGSVTASYEYSGNVKKDNVISCSPTGYNTVTTQIKLVVSKGIKPVNVTGVSIPSSLTVKKGTESTLSLTVTPSDATNQKCTWKSSNTSVATVSSNGTVKAVGGGTATITVTSEDGGYSASCKVTVTIPVPDVTGKTESSAKNELTNAGFRYSVSYVSSSDPYGAVISYSPTGYTSVGSEITLKVSSGLRVTGISLSRSSLTLKEGEAYQLSANISPSNAYNKNCTWTSSNSAVKVNSSGYITASSVGTATVTATTDDGRYTAKCTVTVLGNVPNVTGSYYTNARSSIENAGFDVSISQVYDESAARGTVISYSPSGYCEPGTRVTIKVSKGTSGKYVSSLNGYSSNDYSISTAFKYRSRTRSKETTTSTSSSLSGWTRYDSKTVTNYKNVTTYTYHVYSIAAWSSDRGYYDYTYWCAASESEILRIARAWYPNKSDADIKKTLYEVSFSTTNYYSDGTRLDVNGCTARNFYDNSTTSVNVENTPFYYKSQSTKQVANGSTTTYYYYRWTAWSDWGSWSGYTDSVPANTDTRQYDYQTYYYVKGRDL